MYWVNRGQKGRTVIAAAGMDGSNRRELTVVSMEEPVGLSLDHVAGRLYWISEYKEVGTGGSRAQPHHVLGGGVGVGRVALAPLWHGKEQGAAPWHTLWGWEGECSSEPHGCGALLGSVAEDPCSEVCHAVTALCPQSIETLQVDGSGRHSFPSVLRSHTEPLGLAVFESRFFWADGTELVSASRASPQEHAVLLRAPVSAFTVLHVLQQPPREYCAGSHLMALLAPW